MTDNVNDILNDGNDPSQDKMLRYLQGELSDEERNKFEQLMESDEFLNDAVEGLEDVNNKQSIDLMVHQLNKNLKNQTGRKKKRKQQTFKDTSTINFAIILILLLAVIAWLVINKFN